MTVFVVVHGTFTHESFGEKIVNRVTFAKVMMTLRVSCFFWLTYIYNHLRVL